MVVSDYLSQPYSFERFLKTINRINTQLLDNAPVAPQKEDSNFIVVKENRSHVKLFFDEICYLEGQKE
jgi:two-component system LytT family response regulator